MNETALIRFRHRFLGTAARCAVLFLALVAASLAQQAPSTRGTPRRRASSDEVSPARRIERRAPRVAVPPVADSGFRSLDGRENNRDQPEMGAAGTALMRVAGAAYSDRLSAMAGDDRPGPREISNLVFAQVEDLPNPVGASDFLWLWGQFVDHDIDLTDGVDPPEPAPIAVPLGDAYFDPDASGDVEIAFNRSIYDPESGGDWRNPRQQLNEISAWIDASNVYGSNAERSAALRANDGSGALLTSAGDLLPFNELGLPNAGGDSAELFLAGDVRANEHVGLLALHTLFVREHNRLAASIRERFPGMSGEEVFQRARRLVGAEMQAITYNEFLPALLGADALRPYRGYLPRRRVAIANEFSTAAYRFGHSALSPVLLRLDSDGREIAAGHLALRDAFFAPERLSEEGGIDPVLRGMASQTCQDIDTFVIDDVRNFLFGPPGAGGFDLVSLNIQRGRDHGLPSYNRVRRAFGLRAARRFRDIASDPEVAERLRDAYGDVEAVDAWVGGLAEDPIDGALVGELVFTVLRMQFELLRDGDRFWYQRILRGSELREIENLRLVDVIRRNTEIGEEIQDDVFHTP
jgi:hypothetical protein